MFLFSSLNIEHRHFLEFVHFSESEVLFAMTTDDSTAKKYG